jgi:hypothetical protein
MKRIAAAVLAAGSVLAITGWAHAQSGLVGKKERLPDITLAAGEPMAEKPIEIEAGKYYELKFVADGSSEITVTAPGFFRNIWIDEVVINDIEVRPLGLDSLEFDDEGEAALSFVPIKPGKFELRATGAEPLTITVK